MRIRHILWLIIAMTVIVACGKDSSQTTSTEGPAIILISSEPTSFDPQVPFDDSDFVLGNIYEPLVRFDSGFQLSPGLAMRWTNPDDKTWRFYLSERAHFSNGSPLKASDVKFSIERLKTLSHSDRQGFTEHITSVEVVDARTVDVNTDAPLIILNNMVYIPIVSESDVKANGNVPTVGTGPYKLKFWDKTKKVVLDVNQYHKPSPRIKQLAFVLSSGEKVLQDIANLKADVTLSLPYRKIEEFQKLKQQKQMKGLNLVSTNGITVLYAIFSMKDSIPDFPGKNPLADLRVRQAIAYATDRNELVHAVFKGFGRPAQQLIAPEIFGFDPEVSVPGFDPASEGSPSNLEKAQKLASETGLSKITIPIYSTEGGTNRTERLLIQQWEKAGIHAELKFTTNDEMTKKLNEGSIPITLTGYSCGSGDASELLTWGLHTRGKDLTYGKGNYAYYSNPEVDRICHDNLRVFNPKERLEMLQKSLRIVSEDLPYLPLVIFNDVYIVSDRIQWQAPVNGDLNASEMSFKK